MAAPAAAKALGDWGADVIKIESLKGDMNRGVGGINLAPTDDDDNPSFDTANMNKRFVALNTREQAGKDVLDELLQNADVFVTNYRNKALEAMGLDWESMHAKYPKIIFAQVLGFGEKGPDKDTAGFDYTAYGARGGLLGSSYQLGESPINIPPSFGDLQVSLLLAGGICAALVEANRTGTGDKVTVSLHGAALYMTQWGTLQAEYGSHWPKSRLKPNMPSINVYKASDRWIQMCGSVYNFYYDRIMQVIGRDDLVGDPTYNDLQTIQDNDRVGEVVHILDEAIAKNPQIIGSKNSMG